MEPVYGRKATAGARESWMERYSELRPEGGFRSVVREFWSRTATMAEGASSVSSSNGHVEMKAVYGRKRLAADGGATRTWMDRFVALEPAGGFRDVVEQVRKQNASTTDNDLTALAA